ncbi:ankyrin repeat, PH and SEC7 domain containing protein secG-like [Pecten maximus]|uniref:ankyrin repeat, PH and SEC7 domain containing protein secG-like n=1 Tax=Pecten maximus TaxID=6579 RepID=UPI0014581BA2|nr:ankyrin repeat, PH and SEC7 domain containing protein secG-like [Pecten maximus]
MCAYLIKQYPKLRVKIEGKKIMDTLTHNDDTSSLNHMCVTGNTAMCLYLMKKYPSTLHQKGPLGSHCLHLIAASGIVNCFKSVIPLVHPGKTKYEAEQFIETLTDDYGQTCLHHACVKGHAEMCLYLAEEYWSLLEKKNRYGSHCLHLAAKSGRVDCFKVVVILILGDKTKSNVLSSLETLTNRNGKTVLHKAGVKGKTEMCEYLVSEFPSLLSQRSVGGNHCLHYIAQSGQIECFKSVATLTLKGKNEKEREKFMLDLKNNRGKTVLEKARENQQTEMCSYLEREFNFLSEKKLHAH